MLLSGCAVQKPVAHPPATAAKQVTAKQTAKAQPAPTREAPHAALPKLDLRQRLFLPEAPSVAPAGDQGDQTLYSFKANGLPITDALTMFARSYHLNMIMDPYAITGTVTVEFHDVPFDQAMEAILHTAGYHWYRDGALIFVEAYETRQFVLDYLGNKDENQTWDKLGTKSDNSVWKGLEKKIKTLLSDNGKLVISRLAGTIQVTDRHPNVEKVAEFLNQLRQSLQRQVELEMKIVEVTLHDNNALGIDWNRINMGGLAVQFNLTTSNSGIVLNPTLQAGVTYNTKQNKGDISSVIKALSEQGDVHIVSQPRIRTMNNQPALVRVGTDQPFFTPKVTTVAGTTTGNNNQEVSIDVTTAHDGFELRITPQISATGWVVMDVQPSVTRVTPVTYKYKQGTVQAEATAPSADVRTTNSIVRVRDGQTAVIGGLIQTTKSDTDRKVPLLGDLPLLGTFFKGNYKQDRRTELVIFLTPHLIDATGAIR